MSELGCCPGCRRHVRVTDARCPFCKADVSAIAPQRATPSRLTRAAIFSAAALASGCEKEPPKPKTPVAAAPKDAAIDAAPVPPPDQVRHNAKPYGAPPARRRIV